MRKNKYVFISAIITLLAFTSVLYTSCRKDACSGVSCYNGGVCSGGACECPSGYGGRNCQYTSIVYQNNTFTPVTITVNGTSDIIPVGGTITYLGSYGDVLTGTASTSGTTSSGGTVGETISWTLNAPFPSNYPLTQSLDVSPDYFFLRVVNNNTSGYSIQTVYVNYNLAPQTMDNVTIPDDNNIYNIGYYQAYSNSNVRLESASSYWYFSPLNLPNTLDQTITITAN